MVTMSVRADSYEIQTFYGRVAYIGFLLYGGIYSETKVNQVFRALGIFLSLYTVVVVVGGTIFYSILHRHEEFTIAERLFTLVNMSGVLAVSCGQLINTIYRESIKASIKSMDNHFYTDSGQRGMRSAHKEALNITRIIYSMIAIFAIGITSFLVLRPLGLAILGSENMNNLFFQLNILPLEFVEKRYGLVATYWLTFGLIAPAAIYTLLSVVLGVLVVSVIPGTIYNSFWHLRCRIVEESEVSIQNFKKYQSEGKNEECERETKEVVRRFAQYIECYQKLIAEMRTARGYTEIFYSAMYAAAFVLSIPGGILITTKEDIPIYAIFSLASLSSATIAYIIIFAHIGTLLEEVNTETMMSLYGSPWQFLKPKQRKILIIFMSMLQRPITLQIFKIRPVTVVLLLRFCQLNYTVINLIRMTTASE